jgi:hypothetical protein
MTPNNTQKRSQDDTNLTAQNIETDILEQH